MDTNLLKLTVIDQNQNFRLTQVILERTVPDELLKTKKIVAITGIRRSGKSTLLWLISRKINTFYYLNFEDERLLNFSAENFNDLLEIYFELFGEQKIMLFDEIQNIPGWEKFVRRLFDEGYKIFITGSNSKLLSSEMATALTGRHIKYELYPLSFKEYLLFNHFTCRDNYHYATKEKSKIKKYLTEYIEYGGFPEIIKSKSKTELSQLYQDIIIKDLIVRFGIKETHSFRELAMYLVSNITSYISYNNLAKTLHISSVTTVKNFISYFEEAYIMFSVSLFDYSYKKQIINNKKIYVIDTGIYNAISLKFSANTGAIFENIVFIELKRRNKEVYYYYGIAECDFLIREETKIRQAIQVCSDISKVKTYEREIKGLCEACNQFNLKEGTLITYDLEKSIKHEGVRINMLPLWKWLL